MLPDPLHPALVHFPIVLTILLPVVALVALWRIRRGTAPRTAWSIAVLAAAALSASAWAAVQTGEGDEEAVEEVVAGAPLERHEEAAERFLLLTGGMLVIAAAGLLRGRAGATARVVSTVAALGLVVAGVQVGHSGGELVYRYNAASAHVTDAAGDGRLSAAGAEDRSRGDRKDEDD